MTVLIFTGIMVVILAIGAIIGVKRGFVRSIAGLMEYIIAFFAANRLYVRGAELVVRIPFLAKLKTDVEMPDLESGTGFFEKIKVIVTRLLSNSSGVDEVEAQARAIANNYIADLVSKAIAFIAIFIVALLLLKLIVFLIDRFCQLPFLNAANRTLGLVFGLLCGLFVTWFISNLFINTFLPICVEKWPDIFSLTMADHAVVKFFTKFSPIALVMYVVNLISSIGVK